MYCATCGSLINRELNYCNRCGAKVDKLTTVEKSSPALSFMAVATGFVGLGGLSLTVGLIAILLEYNVVPTAVVIITLAFLSAVFGISFSMLQQLSKMSKPASDEKKIVEKANPSQLGAGAAPQLEEPREPARRMSVTENTTRTLDEVLAKRNSQ